MRGRRRIHHPEAGPVYPSSSPEVGPPQDDEGIRLGPPQGDERVIMPKGFTRGALSNVDSYAMMTFEKVSNAGTLEALNRMVQVCPLLDRAHL